MKIVVLDGYAMNPGDMSWEALQMLGKPVIYERSASSEIGERIANADIVLTNKVSLSEKDIKGAALLKYIGVMATGYNVVDITATNKRNIIVTNVPSYSTLSVAQLTFAMILELCGHISEYSESVRKDEWIRSKDFSYQLKPIMELNDKTLGIIGFGQIGQAVARIALSFGMKVIASHKHPERDKMDGVFFVKEETCFKDSDILSLHCPLNDENKNFVNTRLLKMMKATAYLVNTSRGGLINEPDLAQALNSGVITGAGLDVLSTEPPTSDNPLLKAKNCLITPHIAWATFEARSRLMDTVVNNIRAFINGKPENVVGQIIREL